MFQTHPSIRPGSRRANPRVKVVHRELCVCQKPFAMVPPVPRLAIPYVSITIWMVATCQCNRTDAGRACMFAASGIVGRWTTHDGAWNSGGREEHGQLQKKPKLHGPAPGEDLSTGFEEPANKACEPKLVPLILECRVCHAQQMFQGQWIRHSCGGSF